MWSSVKMLAFLICIYPMHDKKIPSSESKFNMGIASGAGTAYPSGAPEFTPGF